MRRPIPVYFDVDRNQLVNSGNTAIVDSEFPFAYFSEQVLPQITLFNRGGSAYTGFAAATSFSMVVDNDFVQDSSPLANILDANINLAADWSSVDFANGLICGRIDTDTDNMQTALDSADSNGDLTNTKLEVAGWASGEMIACVRMPFYIRDFMGYATTPGSPSSNWYLKTEVDTLLAARHPASITKTANFTLVAYSGPQWCFGDTDTVGAFAFTLPAAADDALAEYYIINIGSNVLSLTPDGVETINGLTGSQTLSAQWRTYHVISDGVSGWYCPDLVIP